MQTDFTFVTGNAAKAKQLGLHLKLPVPPAHQRIDVPEIQSLNPYEVVEAKVKSAYQIIGGPVLVEDVSLRFEAMGNLPGSLIKWFLQELDNEGLCRMLDGYQTRAAAAEVIFGYFDGGEVRYFGAEKFGEIATEPRGQAGFGWDPIFIPEGHTLTWGEMTAEQQAETSMRKLALYKLQLALGLGAETDQKA